MEIVAEQLPWTWREVWPVNFTGLSGILTDRPAKVTDCTVTLFGLSVSPHVQSGSPYLGQAGYLLQTGLFD